MNEITYKGMTAAQYRAAAQKSRERVQQSWKRSDTDGFMSQWVGDLTARMYELQAKILEEGGTAEFPALFDLKGNLIAAKLVSTYDKYSHTHVSKWAILASDDPNSEVIMWIKLSEAQDDERRIVNNAYKGYYEGVVIAPAAADMIGASKTNVSITIKRTDGGFSRDVQIVDSGKLPEVRQLRARSNERRSQQSSKMMKRQLRTKSTKTSDSKPAASSRATSTSHADCKHESTKAARAKCRRERASK
jgi:hypothetical protein